MAKVFRAPEGFEPPKFDPKVPFHEFLQQEEAYVARLGEAARKASSGEAVGEVVRFQRGDGYAQYLVWSEKPLQLIWIQTGDAWQAEPALIRGLRLADVRERVQRSKALAGLMAPKPAAPASP